MDRNLLVSVVALTATFSCVIGGLLLYWYAIQVNNMVLGFLAPFLFVMGLSFFLEMGGYYFSLYRHRIKHNEREEY